MTSNFSMFAMRVVPFVTLAIASVTVVYVLVIIFSVSRKWLHGLMRDALADCIRAEMKAVELSDVDSMMIQIIQMDTTRGNISPEFIEGAYLLYLTEDFARARMEGLCRKALLNGVAGPLPSAVREWESRGLNADKERMSERIQKFYRKEPFKQRMLHLFQGRIERYRRRSIRDFSAIFTGVYDLLGGGELASSEEIIVSVI